MNKNCTNCKYFPKYNLGKISEQCGFSLEEFLVFNENGMWCGNYKKIDKKFEKQIIEAERKLNVCGYQPAKSSSSFKKPLVSGEAIIPKILQKEIVKNLKIANKKDAKLNFEEHRKTILKIQAQIEMFFIDLYVLYGEDLVDEAIKKGKENKNE